MNTTSSSSSSSSSAYLSSSPKHQHNSQTPHFSTFSTTQLRHPHSNTIGGKTTYNWKHSQTLLLINTYNIHQHKFTDVRYKAKQVWAAITTEIQEILTEKGDTTLPTQEQLSNKWKSLTSTFRKYTDENNKSGNGTKSPPPFFNEMSNIYGYRPNVTPQVTLSSTGNGDKKRKIATVEDADEDQHVDVKRPRKSASSTGDKILEFLNSARVERQEREERLLEAAQKMHEEKMALMGQLVNILRKQNNEVDDN